MAPQDNEADGSKSGVAEESGQRRHWARRAARHALQLPLRYRREGEGDWRGGETINISQSGLLFSSNEMLEIDARIEITFQTSGNPLLQSSTRRVLVVRRVLSNWPETRLFFGGRFSL
jgi:hypothetical protein